MKFITEGDNWVDKDGNSLINDRPTRVIKPKLQVKFNFKSLKSKIIKTKMGRLGIFLARPESSPVRPPSQEMSPASPDNFKA